AQATPPDAAPTPTPPPAAVVLPQLPPTEPSAPVLPAVPEESGGNCYALREPHRGESPMTHTWKLLGLNTLLAAALATPALAGQLDGPPAGQVEGNKPDPVLEKLKGLENKLDAMESSLKAKLDNLDTNVQLKNAKLQTDVEDLKRQITQLRQDLDA